MSESTLSSIPARLSTAEVNRLQQALHLAMWGSGDSYWRWQASTDIIEVSTITDIDTAACVELSPMLEYLQSIHPKDLHMVMIE